MRRAIVPLALALALATGFFLAEFRLVVLAPIGTDGASAHANVAIVRRFYEAVNHTLGTGDAAALDDLLAADFVEHTSRPGQTTDRSGLVSYLQVLRLTEPALVLTGHDLVAERDRVSALTRVKGASGAGAVGLPPIVGRPWGTIDVFRLRAGRIAEHWGEGIGLGLVQPLLAVDVPVEPPATKWVEVARLTYPPRGIDQHWANGPTILVVESGRLNIAHDPMSPEAATVIPPSGERSSVPPGGIATLGTGDTLVLERRSLFETRNDGMMSAAVLMVRSGTPSNPTQMDWASAAPGAQPGTPAPAPANATLAGGHPVSFPDGRAGVAIGRIALAPGAALGRHQVAYAEFMIVESGSLALTVEDGKAWVRAGPGDAPREATDTPIAAGAGLTFDAGTTVAVAPAGNTPLVVLVISIGPAVDGDPSVS